MSQPVCKRVERSRLQQGHPKNEGAFLYYNICRQNDSRQCVSAYGLHRKR